MPHPFNNAVYARRGNAFERGDPISYRCDECRGVFDAMWGYICNECREKERRHKELLAALTPVSTTEEMKTIIKG